MAGVTPMCRVCKVVQANYTCSCASPPTPICEACWSAHSLTKGASRHDAKLIPRPHIEAAPLLCSVCHNSPPEYVCACNPNGPGFCGETCQSVHRSLKNASHTFLPISAKGRITDKGYMERLQNKQKAYRWGKQTLKKNLYYVEICKQKVKRKAEYAIKKITEYQANVTKELDEYKLSLEKLILKVESELELHIHDHDYVPKDPLIAATLFNDKPPLRLFSFDNDNSLYRVWYETRLKPSEDTLPVRWPIWAARPPGQESSSESGEEDYEPRPFERKRRPPKPYEINNGVQQPSPSLPIPQSQQSPSPPVPNPQPSHPPAISDQQPSRPSPVTDSEPSRPSQAPDLQPSSPSTSSFISLTTETISRSVSLSTPREVSIWASAVLLLDEHLFTCGGNEPISSEVHLINPITGLISRLANMKSQRYAHGIVLFRKNIYVFGGKNDSNPLLSCEKYANSAWEELASMNTPRAFFNPCVIGATVFLMGGEDTKNCEKYSFETGSFDNLEVKLPVTGWTCAIYLNDQEILIVQKGLTVKWEVGSGIVEGKKEQAAIDLCWGNMSPVVFRTKAYIPRFYEGSPLQVDIY